MTQHGTVGMGPSSKLVDSATRLPKARPAESADDTSSDCGSMLRLRMAVSLLRGEVGFVIFRADHGRQKTRRSRNATKIRNANLHAWIWPCSHQHRSRLTMSLRKSKYNAGPRQPRKPILQLPSSPSQALAANSLMLVKTSRNTPNNRS